VSESLDDVLHISKDSSKKSAKKVAPLSSKSSKTSSGGGGLFDLDDDGGMADDMGTDDIMKYIQQNQAADRDDDLDLFS
jgi:hypothetical protein